MQRSAIEVQHLVRVFRKKDGEILRAVDGISFDVRKGEIFGFLGPNGAGKTTTLKILTTLLQPTSGTASVHGYDVVRNPLGVRKHICVVLQQDAIELHLSVRNNFRTFGRFHGLSAAETDRHMDRVVELFGLREQLNEKGMDLSGGLKRRVQVAKMFMIDKPVVFLDEATTGMDAFNKRTTLAAIKEEAAKGRTIVLTTHLLEEAESLCDSIAIIHHGKIIARGSVDEVKSMGLRLLQVSLTFEKMTKHISSMLKAWKPIRMEMKDSQVEMTVKDEETAYRVLAAARRTRRLQAFEINAASLEDVFVELIDRRMS
ncbi:MAG TPA: ABC transporter ATP-binding protein [Bacteroidota bacterium]|nr:ABC transporter ATP-binding protein [Bacteroidota bacterium]